MASPQLEDGFARIANEILDAIAASDMGAAKLRIVVHVLRETYGRHRGRKLFRTSAPAIAEATGIHLRNVQKAVAELIDGEVLVAKGHGAGARAYELGIQKDHERWPSTHRRAAVPRETASRNDGVEPPTASRNDAVTTSPNDGVTASRIDGVGPSTASRNDGQCESKRRGKRVETTQLPPQPDNGEAVTGTGIPSEYSLNTPPSPPAPEEREGGRPSAPREGDPWRPPGEPPPCDTAGLIAVWNEVCCPPKAEAPLPHNWGRQIREAVVAYWELRPDLGQWRELCQGFIGIKLYREGSGCTFLWLLGNWERVIVRDDYRPGGRRGIPTATGSRTRAEIDAEVARARAEFDAKGSDEPISEEVLEALAEIGIGSRAPAKPAENRSGGGQAAAGGE